MRLIFWLNRRWHDHRDSKIETLTRNKSWYPLED